MIEQIKLLVEGSNIPDFFSIIWNWSLLSLYIVAIIITLVLIARDAHERGYGWLATMAWCALVLVVFPVGLALYFLMVRKDFRTWKAG
jgi:hypothetical protein